MIWTQNVTKDWNLNKGCKLWKTQKSKQKSGKEKQKKKEKKQKTKQKPKINTHKTKRKERERESDWEKSYPPNPPNFSEWFFTCSLPVCPLKSLERNPFTLFKLCYLIDVIFFVKAVVFLWAI